MARMHSARRQARGDPPKASFRVVTFLCARERAGERETRSLALSLCVSLFAHVMHKIQANVHKKPGDWLLRRRPANNKFLFFIYVCKSHPGCRMALPDVRTAAFLLINFHWRDAAIIKSQRLYSPPRALNNEERRGALC